MHFVLTGAPGAGKTVLAATLRQRGYAVVPEAATDVIAKHQAAGVEEPWLRAGFASEVALLQRQREREVSSPPPAVRFFDRSPLCTLALVRYLELPVPSILSDEVTRVVQDQMYARDVFLVRPLGFITATSARRISYDEAQTFETVHERVYREHGFALIDVPAAPAERRADLVEAHILGKRDCIRRRAGEL